MYDRTTVQAATFNTRDQLYCGHIDATALFGSPVVSAMGFESDDPGSSPDRNQSKINNQLIKYSIKLQHQNLYSPYRSLYITCGINKENLFKITSFTSL